MGNLCCINHKPDNDYDAYKYKKHDYIKKHNDKTKEILINTYTNNKLWVSVTENDYNKYKNNSDEVINAISSENNAELNIKKGDIIEILLNIDLAPDLYL